MAHGAMLVERLLAALDELLLAPLAIRILDGGEHRLLLLADPLGVVLLRLHLDDDRHEAVLLAAELDALAAVDARLLRLEPQVANEARDGVLLRTERRHPPGVHHVGRGG